MEAYQHKIILDEILKTKDAISLIDSPKLKAFVLKGILEDLKWRHVQRPYRQDSARK